MGPIPSDDGNELYFSDLFIPSYTPTLAALIESRKHGPSSEAYDISKPSILLVAQPDTLPGAFDEIKAIQTAKTPRDNSHLGNGNARDSDRGHQGASLCTFHVSWLIGDRQTIRRFTQTSQGRSDIASANLNSPQPNLLSLLLVTPPS